ncbi:inactive serine/threonine-protein kinase TEX14-like [Mobula hypostoma]|uniref:inactive serine/threonine-protein kinase TEX14-like n=1 Tax=Mobula hypostoma TaxID=723540 RepID=UPI002FC3A83A
MSHLVPLPLPCPVQLGTVKADASGSQLHQFVREGSHTKVKKVLLKGVAVDTRNSLGQTPLFIAALLDLVKVVDVLLMFGADPNYRCDDRSTPVHAAAFSCNQWILSKLLDAGGDLRLNDKDGRLPQVWAQSAGKERNVRILEFMQRCTSHMQEITQQVAYSISHQIGSSSESLIRNPSILNKITYRIKDGEFLSNPKARSISSQTVQCFGFGKFYVLGSTQLAYLASIPLVSEKALVQPDDEPTFSYTTGPYTTMTNLTWNGIRVTVKQMNLPTHPNCSKRLSADLLITEQEYSSHLRHPSLLLLMAVCQLSELDQIRLVYERVNLGSLYGVLHERRSEFPVLRMEMIVQMLLQITDALLYLHSRGYIHRTVTSHAVQLVLPGIAKLSNFEFMVKSVDGALYNNLSQFPVPSQFYNWLAPEVIRGKTATVKSDVYSFCTLVQELFTDAVPWEDLDGFAVKELLAAGRCLTVDDQVPKPYYDIVRMGIQVKPRNRTMNLQDIRFILRNDFKDLISNKKKHTSEKDQSDLYLHDHVNMFETNGVDHRREQEQLQKENAGKGKQPECLEQAQLTSDNDEYSYYNLGRRTSFSPKKCGADNKVRHLNSEPSQQITVLYDCWKTQYNQFEGKAESRAHHGVYIEDKADDDSNPWKKIEQHYDSESSEPPSEKHYSDVLGHLHELDLALDEEMFATSDEEEASIISLRTGREYTSDEGDEQSDRTTTLSQDWSGMEGLESDQENHGMVCQHTLNSSVMEEEDIATSISVQDSISNCKINIQTSKHLMQQAFSALDRTIRNYNPEIGTVRKSKKENQISDRIEKTSCTNLLGYDEVDYPRQNAKGNKQIKSSNEGHLMIPIAVAPPACYQLPIYGVEKIHEANPAGHYQPIFEVLGHTEDERTAGTKGCSSDILKTSETFADGTQTICSLRKQENVEHVDYKFTHDKSVKSMPCHKDKPTMKCKKKMNALAQVHKHENIPVRKGRISMRIPPHGDQQGSRKQCMYLSGNRKIRITQSCNVVAEGVKVRQKKNPEGYHFTNMEKPQDQNCGRTTKEKSEQASVSTNWISKEIHLDH